jgi:hypothetical protein
MCDRNDLRLSLPSDVAGTFLFSSSMDRFHLSMPGISPMLAIIPYRATETYAAAKADLSWSHFRSKRDRALPVQANTNDFSKTV